MHGSSSSNAQVRVATNSLRTVPPPVSHSGTHGHDAGMQRAMEVLLGSLPGDDAQVEMVRNITTDFEDGKIGFVVGVGGGTSSFLGFVGGCIAPCCSNAFLR